MTDEKSLVLFRNALACAQCSPLVDGANLKEPPQTVSQMKRLLAARMIMIEKLIPSSGRLPVAQHMQIETQMYYVRIIAIAYLPE